MRTAVLHVITGICTILAAPAFAQNWVEITPASGPMPPARQLSAAVYDPQAHAMVVFGGQLADNSRVNDIWAFDLNTNTWSDITPASGDMPVGRITPATVYDPDHHQMLLFSGQGAGAVFLNDTWSFDLSSNAWHQFAPAAMPTTRYGVASCYDAVGQTQVIFAGFTFQGRFDDTWRFGAADTTWTDVTPAGISPLERCLHAACYDSQERRMVMYGGQNGGPLGDIWIFDLTAETWTNVTPGTGPQPRWFSTLEYDPNNHRATMFSGNRSGFGLANDVWAFDLWNNQWTELFPTGTKPAIREGAASIMLPAEDRMVVFGGRSTTDGILNDVWSLENLSDTPTGVRPTTAARAILRQNYPNPFNPTTVIAYETSSEGTVRLGVFDAAGRTVRTLVNEVQPRGAHTVSWDGRNDAGESVATGVYLYRLEVEGTALTRKMTLLK